MVQLDAATQDFDPQGRRIGRPQTLEVLIMAQVAPMSAHTAPLAAAQAVASQQARIHDLMRAPESRGARIARLQAEARTLAGEHVDSLTRLLAQVVAEADAVADGGSAYPVGVRELALRLAEDLSAKSATLSALRARTV